MNTFKSVILFITMIIFVCAVSFGITSALIYGVCWAFNYTFSWKFVFMIWLLITLLSSTFKVTIKK